MTVKRVTLTLVSSVTRCSRSGLAPRRRSNVNLTVSGTGEVLVQAPHVISGTIVGYTTDDACTVDPAQPLKQGEKINCSFPNVPNYVRREPVPHLQGLCAPGWGFAGWEPCGFACSAVYHEPCGGTNTSPRTFVDRSGRLER